MTDKERPSAPVPPTLTRVGVGAWTFIGVVAAVAIVVLLLASVVEIVLPVALAALVAIACKPAADALVRRGRSHGFAAGMLVLGLGLIIVGVLAAVIAGVVREASSINHSVDAAVQRLSDETSISTNTLTKIRRAIEGAAPMVRGGAVTTLVPGVGSILGFVSGALLGTLAFYYLVKDGGQFRRRLVVAAPPARRRDLDDYLNEAFLTIRRYGRARTVLSAVVAAVIGLTALLLGLPVVVSIVAITFIGGYIPYLGAFVAGAYAVVIAFGEKGVVAAVIVIVVSLAANLVLENFVEPKVMGTRLHIHPLVVLIVTALGGLLGGIVGLIVAVPFYVLTRKAVVLIRSLGYVEAAADAGRPAAERLLRGD